MQEAMPRNIQDSNELSHKIRNMEPLPNGLRPRGIVLQHNDSRLYALDGLPDPIIHPIDVQRRIDVRTHCPRSMH